MPSALSLDLARSQSIAAMLASSSAVACESGRWFKDSAFGAGFGREAGHTPRPSQASPIPISVGFPNGAMPKAEMTLGEVTPQTYESRNPAATVAWSVRFRSPRLVAAATAKSSIRNIRGKNLNAEAVSRATVAGQAMPSGFDYLMVRVPVSEFPRFRILQQGFGVIDVIGNEAGFLERWIARISGR